MEDILYRYNPWWETNYVLEGIIQRNTILEQMNKYLSSGEVVFLTGLRRVGKTTLLKLFIKYLIEKKEIATSRIFYISLDDYLISKNSIIEIVENYRKIQKISFKEKVYLFLDEIAYKENYEQQLKNLYDSQNVKIYSSSSSASILKTRKPYLTGRNVILEIMPLDFQEYLDFKQIKISKADKHLLEKYFEDYLKVGGLPEYVLHEDVEYLKELVNDIIYKDIVALYKVKNPDLLKDFFMLLMERAGKIASINKLARILNISPDTAKRYLQMFADTYLIYLVRRHGKTNEKILSPKKVYASDLGIRTFFTGFRDKGSLFENYVYLKIKNKNPQYIYQDNSEIDFLTEDKTLIEVKYQSTMSEKQETLFKKVRAKEKILIKNIHDLSKLVPP